jgi:hypothetical protein
MAGLLLAENIMLPPPPLLLLLLLHIEKIILLKNLATYNLKRFYWTPFMLILSDYSYFPFPC